MQGQNHFKFGMLVLHFTCLTSVFHWWN